jgi:hypothetical protein
MWMSFIVYLLMDFMGYKGRGVWVKMIVPFPYHISNSFFRDALIIFRRICMSNPDYGYFLSFIGVVLVGAIEVAVIHSMIKRTSQRILHLMIPATVLLIGYFLLMEQFVLTFFYYATFLFIVPMVVIITFSLYPGLTGSRFEFKRILICYIFVSACGYLIYQLFLNNILMMGPELFTPFFKAQIYAATVIMDTVSAFVVYGVMNVMYPAPLTVKENKTE